MELRELTKADSPSLLELYVQLDEKSKDLSVEKSVSLWKDQIENNQNITYFGAIDNGKVVSTCYCVIIPNLTHFNQSICFVENVVTDINYRKQGLARKVINMAIEKAKESNCYKVILQSNVKRTEAHKFYENLGFNSNNKKAFDLRIENISDNC